MPDLFDLVESASLLRISETTLRRFVKARKIPFRKIGRRYFFSMNDIYLFLENIYHPIEDGGKK